MMRTRWTTEEQALFFKRLSELLMKGYSLNEALEFLKIHLGHKQRTDIEYCLNQLNKGNPLHIIFSQLCFQPICISYIYFGEKHGRLTDSFYSISSILLKKSEEQRKLFQLLAYPIFLIVFVMTMFLFFNQYIIPQFLQFYQSFQLNQSTTIKIFLWLHQHFISWTTTFIITIFLIVSIFMIVYKRKSPLKRQMMKCHIPLLGSLQKLWNSYYFSYHLSELLKGGASISDSLIILGKDPKKLHLKEVIEVIHASLLRGESLGHSCKNINIWNKDIAFVIDHGQKNGKLSSELSDYSTYCFEEFIEKMERWTKILQPVIFTWIGLVILVIYLSIMQPTFQIMNQL